MSTVVTGGGVSRPLEPRGFGRLWRVLKQLFHELTGATFAVLSLAWFNSAIRAWSRDAADWLIALPVVVGLIFVAFALTSFRRARQL
jgi:ABC-type Fe3+ transport system permease subunit